MCLKWRALSFFCAKLQTDLSKSYTVHVPYSGTYRRRKSQNMQGRETGEQTNNRHLLWKQVNSIFFCKDQFQALTLHGRKSIVRDWQEKGRNVDFSSFLLRASQSISLKVVVVLLVVVVVGVVVVSLVILCKNVSILVNKYL